jgi:hypothetical protein
VMTILGVLAKKKGGTLEAIRQAVLRASQYGAVIGVLYVVGHYDASLHQWAVGAAWVIGLTELAAGISAAGVPLVKPPTDASGPPNG